MALFITYSSRDEQATEGLLTALHQAHEEIWLDEQLAGGQQWWGVILEQIRQSDVFVIAFSQNWINSKPCQAEFGYAKALGKPLLPVQIGPVESMRVNPLFSTQVIDFQSPSTALGIQLVYALNASRGNAAALPDPLPSEPPVPYEYLARLHASVASGQLDPAAQETLIDEFNQRLIEDGDDPGARADIEQLLGKLWRRGDLTESARSEVGALLHAVQQRAGAHAAAQPPAVPPTPVIAAPAKRLSRVMWALVGLVAAGVVSAVVSVISLAGKPSENAAPAAGTPGVPPGTSAPAGITLPANKFGYVNILVPATRELRCMVDPNTVICEMPGDGWPAHGVKISADGRVEFADGNIGMGTDEHSLDDSSTYSALGWTITTSASATRFVSAATGHGAQVTQYDVLRV